MPHVTPLTYSLPGSPPGIIPWCEAPNDHFTCLNRWDFFPAKKTLGRRATMWGSGMSGQSKANTEPKHENWKCFNPNPTTMSSPCELILTRIKDVLPCWSCCRSSRCMPCDMGQRPMFWHINHDRWKIFRDYWRAHAQWTQTRTYQKELLQWRLFVAIENHQSLMN